MPFFKNLNLIMLLSKIQRVLWLCNKCEILLHSFERRKKHLGTIVISLPRHDRKNNNTFLANVYYGEMEAKEERTEWRYFMSAVQSQTKAIVTLDSFISVLRCSFYWLLTVLFPVSWCNIVVDERTKNAQFAGSLLFLCLWFWLLFLFLCARSSFIHQLVRC